MALQNATAISTTGRDLRATRIRYGVRAEDVGRHLGVTGERVRQLERSPLPKPSDVGRYMRAVQALARSAS